MLVNASPGCDESLDNQPTPHALERSTRRLWDQWLELLDARACATMPHPGIAQTALELMPEDVDNPQWWAQKVAITYEQHRGLRALGQASDGKFAAQASKTTPLTLDDALTVWANMWDGRQTVNGIPMDSAPTHSATDKWRYWRVKLADGTKVTVTIGVSARGGSTVAVQHAGLSDDDARQEWRTWWRDVMTQFAASAKSN